METHALSVFNQQLTNPLIKMPPTRIGPYLPPRPIINDDDDVDIIKYHPTGEYHPIARAAAAIHMSLLDLLLKLHNLGTFPLAHNFREQFGPRGKLHIY